DGLCDLNLDEYLRYFYAQKKTASFLAVKPSQSFHHVSYDENGLVTNIGPIDRVDFWINGGYFIFKRHIFDYIQDGEELVVEPFQRLIAEKELITYRNPGFWACMDTFKEKKMFDDKYANGEMPWMVWDPRFLPPRQRMLARLERSNDDQVVL